MQITAKVETVTGPLLYAGEYPIGEEHVLYVEPGFGWPYDERSLFSARRRTGSSCSAMASRPTASPLRGDRVSPSQLHPERCSSSGPRLHCDLPIGQHPGGGEGFVMWTSW
jgi:hypothetical protein